MIVSVGEDAARQEEPRQESPSLFKDFQAIYPSDNRPQGGEEDGEGEELPPSPPHRVFVKPAAEDSGPIIKHPLLINPDDSYQEFSNYTRRL